ncbi:MAG: metal ABC transporter permease [Myxococcales bacterium]|nr:metal ABC transporter permease [Myxococcales bacterium]
MTDAFIESFIQSWHLFREAYLAGWLAAAALAAVGVFVIARDQIFVGAAISEASALGVAVSLWVLTAAAPHAHGAFDVDPWCRASAVLFGLGAAAWTGRARRAGDGASAEAVTGWVFLASGSGAILLVAQSPFGLEEVHRLLFSSIIGATWGDVAVLGALVLVGAATLAKYHRPLLLLTLDPVTARAVGVPVRRGAWAIVLALGLVVGLTLRLAGLLFVFGNLVLPGLAAQALCREVRAMLWTAPLVAVGASVGAFVLANAWDLPPAQMDVAVLALVVAALWIVRSLRS